MRCGNLNLNFSDGDVVSFVNVAVQSREGTSKRQIRASDFTMDSDEENQDEEEEEDFQPSPDDEQDNVLDSDAFEDSGDEGDHASDSDY